MMCMERGLKKGERAFIGYQMNWALPFPPAGREIPQQKNP